MTERKSHALGRDRKGNRSVTLGRPAAPLNRQIANAGDCTADWAGVAARRRLHSPRPGPYQSHTDSFAAFARLVLVPRGRSLRGRSAAGTKAGPSLRQPP